MSGNAFLIQVILGIGVLGTGLALHTSRRSGRLPWDGGSWMILVIGLLMTSSNLWAKFTDSFTTLTDEAGNVVATPIGFASELDTVARYGTLAIGIAVLWHSYSRHKAISAPGMILACISAYAGLIELLRVGDLPNQTIFFAVVLVAAAWAPFSREAAVSGVALFGLLTATLSAVYAAFQWDHAAQACTRKCIILNTVFSGAAPHANQLALILTLCLPMLWLAFTGWRRWITTGFVLFEILLTASRTSAAVAVPVLVVMIILRIRRMDEELPLWKANTLRLAVVGTSVASFWVALVPHSDLFATTRGYLWRIALEQIQTTTDLFWGKGAHAWQHVYEQGLISQAANYATHNQWLESLLETGLIGVAALAAVCCLWLFGAGSRRLLNVTAPVLGTIFGIGLFERPISLSMVEWNTPILIALVIATNQTAAERRRSKHSAAVAQLDREDYLRAVRQGITPLKLEAQAKARSGRPPQH